MPRITDRLFAAVYDRIFARCERQGLSDMRAALVERAGGDVVEIGAGTGLNLDHYPDTIGRLVLTEPEEAMAKNLRLRVASRTGGAEVLIAPGERLPVPDDAFDTAVGTLVLCTAPDPAAVLREVERVLRPGGVYLFMEHVRAPEDAPLGRWQDRISPIWPLIAGGCRPNRRTADTLGASGLEVIDLQTTEMPRVAGPIVRPLIVGAARLAA